MNEDSGNDDPDQDEGMSEPMEASLPSAGAPPAKEQKMPAELFLTQELAKLKETLDPENMTATLSLLDTTFQSSIHAYYTCALSLFFGELDPKIQVEKLKQIKPKASLCGKSMDHADIFWMCEDCTKVGNCTCFCSECFEPERHVGHKCAFQVGNVGCCDCGDEASLKPESFCKLHRKDANAASDFDLLPDYQKIYSPMVLEHMMDRFHESVARAEPHKPDHQAILSTSLTLKLLFIIFKASPLFHRMIADALRLEFREHKTRHACSVVGPDIWPEHPCTCSALDNMIKMMLYLQQETTISEFLAELCKVVHDFGLCFLQSFWRNYKYILDLAEERKKNPDFMDKIMWQVIVVDQELVELMPAQIECCTSALEWVVDRILEKNGVLDDIGMSMCMNLYYDFQNFYNKDGLLSGFILQKTDYLPRFMDCMRKLQYAGHVAQMKDHVLFEDSGISSLLVKSLCSVLEMFFFIIRSYTFDNDTVNRMLFSNVFRCLEADMADPKNKEQVNTASIPLLRLFGVMLARFARKFDGCPPVELLSRLQSLAGISMSGLRPILEYALRRTMRALGFLCEINAGCWMYYGAEAELAARFLQELRKESALYIDFALIQILLGVLSEKTVDLFELFESGMMVPMRDPSKTPLPHLMYKPGAAVEPTTTGKIIAMLTGGSLTDSPTAGTAEDKVNATFREKSGKLAEQGMLMMANCLLNDMARISITLKATFRGFKMSVPEPLKESVDYALKKEATNVVLLSEEKSRSYETFSIDNMMEMFPSFLRVNEALDILKGYFKEMRTAKGQLGYRVSSQFPNYANMFNMCNSRSLSSCEANLKSIQKLLSMSFDVFSEGVVDKTFKSGKAAFMREVAANEASLRGLIEVAAGSKEYVSMLVCLRLIYELAQYGGEQWTQPMKEGVIAQLGSASFSNLDKLYSPSVERIRIILLHGEVRHEFTSVGAEPAPAVPAGDSTSLREKRKKIAAEFLAKRSDFGKKHAAELAALGSRETAGESCSFCRESVSFQEFETKQFGYLCMPSSTGIFRRARILTANDLRAKCPHIPPAMEHVSLSPTINTCGHMMHYGCYEEFLKQHSESPRSCPLCKYPFNNFLPALQSPLASAQDLCMKTVLADRMGEQPGEINVAEFVLGNFLKYLGSTMNKVDFNPLHSVLSINQKAYRHMLNCCLSMLYSPKLPERLATPTEASANIMAANWPEVVLSDVLYFVSNTYVAAMREGKPAKDRCKEIAAFIKGRIETALRSFVYQAAVKHLFLEKMGTMSEGYVKSAEIVKDLAEVMHTHEAEISTSVVSFLSKTVFIKSVFEDWIYTDPSVDKLRNIVISTFDPKVTIAKYCCDIIGISTTPLQDAINAVTSGKAEEIGSALVQKWGKDEGNGKLVQPGLGFYMLTTPLVFRLIPLPISYDQVFVQFYTKKCRHCANKIRTKCLCLMCGEVVCAGSPCCRAMVEFEGHTKVCGELTAHAIECGNGVGVFLHIYRGSLILQSELLGVETNSIYANSYGEDVSMFCNPAYVPFNSADLAKYKFDPVRYAYFRDLITMFKEKYEIWQERLLGRPVINDAV